MLVIASTIDATPKDLLGLTTARSDDLADLISEISRKRDRVMIGTGRSVGIVRGGEASA
jgi:hypothetical protein